MSRSRREFWRDVANRAVETAPSTALSVLFGYGWAKGWWL